MCIACLESVRAHLRRSFWQGSRLAGNGGKGRAVRKHREQLKLSANKLLTWGCVTHPLLLHPSHTPSIPVSSWISSTNCELRGGRKLCHWSLLWPSLREWSVYVPHLLKMYRCESWFTTGSLLWGPGQLIVQIRSSRQTPTWNKPHLPQIEPLMFYFFLGLIDGMAWVKDLAGRFGFSSTSKGGFTMWRSWLVYMDI